MERKIRRNIFILVGLSVLLLIGMVLGWFFVFVRPQRENIAKVQGQYDAREKIASTMKTELKNQKIQQDRRKYLQGELTFFQGRYRNISFPVLGDAGTETKPAEKSRRIRLWLGLLRENYSEYGTAIRKTLVDAANASDDPFDGQHFTLTTSIKVDPPPKAPEDIVVPTNGFIRPASATNNGVLNVTVNGSFAEIKRFFARINLSPILFVVGALKLDGTSPNITAVFTVTPYLVARGEGVTLVAGAPAAGGTTTGGAPGGPGGAPGPAGGGPPPGGGTTTTPPGGATPPRAP